MDSRTQRAIETATQRARALLEHDFWEQLEATFDILRDGKISDAGSLHPRAHERARIVASIEHKRAAGMSSKASVADYVRDAAFTFLNRVVALKMLEARGLVRECVSRGEQSAGYAVEFCGLAPGIALLKSAGYRLYLESLFDELATEVKVLFDRRDPASVLWPRLGAFDALVAALNEVELSAAWIEDETIGWVYQYFNTDTERRAMRDASPAPRNSRELAIRNQFFTPAYVVRFLVDNTLGRLWHEMHPNTRLVEQCAYLIPTRAEATAPPRDPRDLRILDPACGSGHFLLYAFDLLLEIYDEAWAIDGGPRWSTTSHTLREDYPDRVALRHALPELILRHNLHGVDIDARCAQIAQLALWMRAQRAYERLDVDRGDRIRIRKVPIVVAEPMPGPREELDDFVSGLEDPVLRDLFTRLVNRLELAGELGLMLKFDDLLPSAQLGQTSLFSTAEERLMAAVVAYAGRGIVQDNARRRIFTDDAVQGLGLLELANLRFDVILMNPPFGERPAGANEYLTSTYPRTAVDLFSVFFERTFELLRPGGRIGVISNRTWLSLPSFEDLRSKILGHAACVEAAVDLGSFVLEAQVETAAIVFRAGLSPTIAVPWIRLLKTQVKDTVLRETIVAIRAETPRRQLFWSSHARFATFPSQFMGYWMSDALAALFQGEKVGTIAAVKQGTATADDFRFVRLGWEVPHQKVGLRVEWAPFAKGGMYSPYYDDIHLAVQWEGDGREVAAFPKAFIRNAQYYGRPGITWPLRTTSPFGPRLLPAGCAFGHKGPAAIPNDEGMAPVLLGCLASRPMRLLLSARLGAGDDAPGSASKSYEVGLVRELPMPVLRPEQRAELARLTTRAIQLAMIEYRLIDEASAVFAVPEPILGATEDRTRGFDGLVELAVANREDRFVEMAAIQQQIDDLVADGLGFTAADRLVLNEELELGLQQLSHDSVVEADLFRTAYLTKDAVTGERLPGGVIAEQDVRIRTRRAKQHAALRSEQVLARLFEAHPGAIVAARRALGLVRKEDREARARDVVSFFAGLAFGRFSAASCLRAAEEPLDPFAELPRPQRLSGIPRAIVVDDEGHRDDLAALISTAARDLLGEDSRVLDEAISHLGGGGDGLRGWLRTGFFDDHLARYSKSRRKAPLYWWLSTPSASYSVWLYAHGLTGDTLYAVQSKYVEPKLERERRALTSLQKDAGTTPSAAVRAHLEKQESLVKELQEFLADLKHVTALWRPTLDDGIVIAQAPLWRLVRHAAWRKELESTWGALANREYDWAHLAIHLWPEEVIPKCAKDRSLAIAHGVEDVFWVENGGKWAPRRTPSTSIDDLVRARSSPAVKAALEHVAATPSDRSEGNGRKPPSTPKRPRKGKT